MNCGVRNNINSIQTSDKTEKESLTATPVSYWDKWLSNVAIMKATINSNATNIASYNSRKADLNLVNGIHLFLDSQGSRFEKLSNGGHKKTRNIDQSYLERINFDEVKIHVSGLTFTEFWHDNKAFHEGQKSFNFYF